MNVKATAASKPTRCRTQATNSISEGIILLARHRLLMAEACDIHPEPLVAFYGSP